MGAAPLTHPRERGWWGAQPGVSVLATTVVGTPRTGRSCCTCCPARCPKGLKTFLQKKQEFPPFPLSGVHSWLCRAEAAEIPVSSSSAPNLTWWLLKPWYHCHHPTSSPGQCAGPACPLCPWAGSQAGHITPLVWVGHSWLEPLWESLGLPVLRKGTRGGDILPKPRVILGA